jgi:hypothetical protein
MCIHRGFFLTMVMALALIFLALPAGLSAQEPPGGEVDPPVPVVDPIVTPERLDELRGEGMSWGEIKHGVALAEKLSADSQTPLSGNEALNQVLRMREEGMGWGNISKELGYKLGPAVSGKSAKAIKDRMKVDPDIEVPDVEAVEKSLQPEKVNKLEKAPKPEKAQKPEKPPKPEKIQKPEKPEKPPKPEKPEKVEKPEKPEKPPKPEKPAKPEKPERVSK